MSAAMLSIGAFCSCSDFIDKDFLDKNPDERVTPSTLEQVLQLLTTAYANGNYGWLGEISSDNIIDINAPYLSTQNDGSEILVHFNESPYERADGEMFTFKQVKSSTDEDSPFAIWESQYNAIATTNYAIQYLDEISKKEGGTLSDKMKAAYAEAYLARAYAHFILVNVFSQAYKDSVSSLQDVGIPYITRVSDKVFDTADRENVTATYGKIQKDLEKGLAWISDINYTKPKWHFNTTAAHAFAARVYLYTHQYDKVIQHADIVLGSDTANVVPKLADYSKFSLCESSDDYAAVWQNPDEQNNLMLIGTYSTQWRKSIGYRYAYAGKAIRDIVYHLGPNWRWYCTPVGSVGGGTFWDGNADHGFASTRIAERFEYSDKVSGIGYAHIVRREFTASELILERAEAKILSNKPIADCVADLIAYEKSRQTITREDKAFYCSSNALTELTDKKIQDWYNYFDSKGNAKLSVLQHSNVRTAEQWATMTNMGCPRVPLDRLPYWNCLNDMRRYENAYTGRRFFDLKRLGIEYSHVFNLEGSELFISWNDKRRAIELPAEVISSGMASSHSEYKPTTPEANNIIVGKCTDALLKAE